MTAFFCQPGVALWTAVVSSCLLLLRPLAVAGESAVLVRRGPHGLADRMKLRRRRRNHRRRKADHRPNVILILAEDMSYGDLGCYGHPYAKTPNLDRLAAEGTKFDRFYVTGATCSPSRTGFMTSRAPASFANYMADFGFQNVSTVTELLHNAGYKTGHIGKWHIGPDDRDLKGNLHVAPDDSISTYGIDDVRIRGGSNSPRNPRGKDAVVFDESLDFIEKNKDKPFYLNIWAHVAHSPVEPHPDLVARMENITVDRTAFAGPMQQKFEEVIALGGDIDEGMRNYLADIWSMDHQIGLVMNKLDEIGLRDQTIVVFTTDHGAAPVKPKKQSSPTNMMGYAGGLRGEKHDFYEGGVRVPFIVRWPDHVPAGRVNDDTNISSLDWLPTVCKFAEAPIDPAMFEGEDLSDIWLGDSTPRVNPLYWRFSRQQGERAILHSRWKMHVRADETYSLYDLETDREERTDICSSKPNACKSMKDNLDKWEASLPKKYCIMKKGCEDPLDFDPNKPPVKIGPPHDVELFENESASELDVASNSDLPDVPFPSTWKKELAFLGKKLDFPLQSCQGDCNMDKDCAVGLKCLKRSDVGGPLEVVPGCIGNIESLVDYCFDPENRL